MITAIVTDEEWTKPDGSPLIAGQHVRLTAFNGSGRVNREEPYASGDEPILGPARYSATTHTVALRFGPTVVELTIELQNPLIIDGEQTLAQFGQDGHLPGNAKEFKYAAEKILEHFKKNRHDGIVVNVGSGETNLRGGRTKRIRAMFGESQVVEPFGFQAKPPTHTHTAPSRSAKL